MIHLKKLTIDFPIYKIIISLRNSFFQSFFFLNFYNYSLNLIAKSDECKFFDSLSKFGLAAENRSNNKLNHLKPIAIYSFYLANVIAYHIF